MIIVSSHCSKETRQSRGMGRAVTMPSEGLKDSLWSERVDLHAIVHVSEEGDYEFELNVEGNDAR